MYPTKEDAKLNREIREEQAAKDARSWEVWSRVEAGTRKLPRADFDALSPLQRINYTRMSGQVE